MIARYEVVRKGRADPKEGGTAWPDTEFEGRGQSQGSRLVSPRQFQSPA